MTGRYRPWLVVALQRIFRPVFALLFRMRVSGTGTVPARGGVILAGNHTGFLDGPLVFLYAPRPARFLVKSEMFASPPLARALGWLGQIPVRRGQPDRAALRTALDVLAAGGVVGVFPEGTRGTGAFDAVHDGLAYLALKSGCPVVPVACLGSAAALPKGSRRLRPRVPIVVAYGEPVSVAAQATGPLRTAVAAASDGLHAALRAHLARVAAGLPPGPGAGPHPDPIVTEERT